MRAIVQRVEQASVSVGGKEIAAIGKGLLILLGVGRADNEEKSRLLAEKITRLRIFGDKAGMMNLSLLDVGGEALVVSQFTLFADTHRGNRPSFVEAATPDLAIPLCDHFIKVLRNEGIQARNGIFGAHMQVNLLNDGPVTIWLEN